MSSIGPHDPVGAVAVFDVETIAPSATLAEVAQAMRAKGCGALLVDRRDGQLAVISERDIVGGLADHGADSGDWVVDVMTTEVVSVPADMAIVEAAGVMRRSAIRHLVVNDDENDRIGIVSVLDVLGPIAEATRP